MGIGVIGVQGLGLRKEYLSYFFFFLGGGFFLQLWYNGPQTLLKKLLRLLYQGLAGGLGWGSVFGKAFGEVGIEADVG